MGDSQRLSDNEQLELLALLETVSTERSAIGAARVLAELMDHLHALGQRIAGELPDQSRHRVSQALMQSPAVVPAGRAGAGERREGGRRRSPPSTPPIDVRRRYRQAARLACR